MTHSLPKRERLSDKIKIQALFQEGKAFFIAPYRVYYHFSSSTKKNPSVQVLFAAPKKKFSKAVQRNRIKRLSKEAYRLQKTSLLKKMPENEHLEILFVYIQETVFPIEKLKGSISMIFKKLLDD